ncbi:MAG TPA: hypothetical protein PKY82_23765 [Pyrinomonadaceae bacterium]|nr:hypothetical protein [Pyrinomonadaceae bacterium]
MKPYVAIYFPDEILQKLKWTRETRLKLSIEKGYLKIEKSDSDEPLYFDFNDLTYEMDEDN